MDSLQQQTLECSHRELPFKWLHLEVLPNSSGFASLLVYILRLWQWEAVNLATFWMPNSFHLHNSALWHVFENIWPQCGVFYLARISFLQTAVIPWWHVDGVLTGYFHMSGIMPNCFTSTNHCYKIQPQVIQTIKIILPAVLRVQTKTCYWKILSGPHLPQLAVIWTNSLVVRHRWRHHMVERQQDSVGYQHCFESLNWFYNPWRHFVILKLTLRVRK